MLLLANLPFFLCLTVIIMPSLRLTCLLFFLFFFSIILFKWVYFLFLNLAVKLLWQGAECWNECLKLLSIAETAALAFGEPNSEIGDPAQKFSNFVVRRRFPSFLLIQYFLFEQVW